MTSTERGRLNRLYRTRLDEAVGLAVQGKDATEAVKHLDALEKLLKATESAWSRDSRIAFSIGLTCVLVALYLWSAAIPTTNVTLRVESTAVQGRLAGPWTLPHAVRASLIHAEGLSSVVAPNLGVALTGDGTGLWFETGATQLTLNSLTVAGPASVAIDTSARELALSLGGGNVRGVVTANGELQIKSGTADTARGEPKWTRTTLIVPETIAFSLKGPPLASIRLVLHDPTDWDLGIVKLNDLDFVLKRPGEMADSAFSSAVLSGTLKFNDASWDAFQLQENDVISAQIKGRSVIRIKSIGDHVGTALDGVVGPVTLGDPGSRRTIAPSFLEYLYTRRSLSGAFSTVVLLWGILWGTKRTLFN